MALCGVVVVLAVALTGPGGSGLQTWDWAKHHAVLRDLVEQPWPVAYATGGDDVGLTYYLAYYLPAALAGKLGGWRLANGVLFAWTAVGAVLAMLWLVVLGRASAWRCLLVFVFFSGLDVVGAAAWGIRGADGRWLLDFDLEWWATHWTYPANVSLMAYAPHQATGGWLLTALVVDASDRYPRRFPYVLAAGLGLLWSPFVTIGLLAVAALTWVTDHGRRRTPAGAVRDIADITGAGVALVLVLYFVSRWPTATLPEPYYPPLHRIAAAGFALAPSRVPWPRFAADYIAFVGLEFLLLAAILGAIHWHHRHDRRLLLSATVVLLALPFFTYGYFNDLVMRASIPGLFVLQCLAVRALGLRPGRGSLRGALVAVLLIGAVYPANMLRLAAGLVVARRALVQLTPRHEVADLFELQWGARASYFYIGQYVGRLDSAFFRILARPPVAIPRGPIKTR
jgi:hypothetical protein